MFSLCSGTWINGAGSVPVCDGGTISNVDSTTLLTVFDLSTLDPAIIAAAFGSGFILMATMSLVTFAAASLLNFIRG